LQSLRFFLSSSQDQITDAVVEKEPEPEGEAALQKLFKQIFRYIVFATHSVIFFLLQIAHFLPMQWVEMDRMSKRKQ
jgi:hypothetical protein